MTAFLLIPWGDLKGLWQWEAPQPYLQPPGSQAVRDVLEPRPGEAGGPWSPSLWMWTSPIEARLVARMKDRHFPSWRPAQHGLGFLLCFPWDLASLVTLHADVLRVGPHPEVPQAPLHGPPWHLTSSPTQWLGLHCHQPRQDIYD